MTRSDPRVLDVLLHGRGIGTLTLLAGSQSVFAFDEEYIEDRARPTLSLSFKDARGGLLTRVRPTHTRVPPFFANLLPEGPLRELLAERAGVHPDREFFLLAALGGDLPGAVKVEPAGDELAGPVASEGREEPRPEASRRVLRFSLAGVQLKFSAVQAAAGGLTIPASGQGGSWIVKLPSRQFPSVPENEHAMMGLAAEVGIEVPPVRLVPVAEVGGLPDDVRRVEGNALAIRRFDRGDDGTPVHIEDFAQVFGVFPEDKYRRGNYRNIAEVLQAEAGTPAVEQLVRRLVYSALIGNGDMHLKNWSLRYPDGRTAELSPAYDLLSTIPYIPEGGQALNLYKAGTKAWPSLSVEGLTRLAGRARLLQAAVLDAARDTLVRFVDAWRSGTGRAGVPRFVAEAIDEHYPGLPIVRDLGV